MSLYDMKNESLFATRISDADARKTVENAVRRGWAKRPPKNASEAHPPSAKKRLNCEDFRTHHQIKPFVQSDVLPPA